GPIPSQVVRNLPNRQQPVDAKGNQQQQQPQQWATRSIHPPPAIVKGRQPSIGNIIPPRSPTPRVELAQQVGVPAALPVPIAQQPKSLQLLAPVQVPRANPGINDPRAISFIPQPPPKRSDNEAAAQRPLQPWEVQERLLQ